MIWDIFAIYGILNCFLHVILCLAAIALVKVPRFRAMVIDRVIDTVLGSGKDRPCPPPLLRSTLPRKPNNRLPLPSTMIQQSLIPQ